MLLQRALLLAVAPWLACAAPTSIQRNETTTTVAGDAEERTAIRVAATRAAAEATTTSSSSTSSSSSSTFSIPTFGSATAASAFSTPSASALAASLPGYRYNLTMENEATRISICNQTTSFCQSAGCSKDKAEVKTNFCNPATMGWNCECGKKADAVMNTLLVPINTYDCRLRTAECLDQCTNPSASPAVTSLSACRQACNYILGSTCGTSNQVLPQYQVKKYDDKPKYYADTTKGGVAMGITVSSSPPSTVSGPLLAALAGAAGVAIMLVR
ncbi:hypothetical protein JCM11251_006945 [Rhodosporidiobolus azoricus]